MISINSFSLWNSDLAEAFTNAMRQRVNVRVRCCILHEGKPADVLLHGRFRKVEGREVHFVVRHKEITQGKCKSEENTCEYFFCLEEETSSGRIRLGYQGAGLVLEVSYNEKNELRNLFLRLTNTCSTRKMRRDRRVSWSKERSRLAGVMPLEEVPATRAELRDLLTLYYNSGQPNPLPLINLSAGGACACVSEEIAQYSRSGNIFYLFFIVPSKAPASAPPHIFLSKKMGISRNVCEKGAGLRLLFAEELNWEFPGPALQWNDILASGSDRLRASLDEYPDDDEETLQIA